MSKSGASFRVNNLKPWQGRVAGLGLGMLLLLLPVSFAALDYLAPQAHGQGQSASSRAGWYLSSGQWQADVRTLVAAFDFVMDLAPDAPAGTNLPIGQLAALSRPTGPNAPVRSFQVKIGVHRLPHS